jgi:hypothetical protein
MRALAAADAAGGSGRIIRLASLFLKGRARNSMPGRDPRQPRSATKLGRRPSTMIHRERPPMNSQAGPTTGTSDPTYNLISVAYHALQAAETYERYAQDAQQQGDRELAQFFRQSQQQARQAADQAKQMLATRLQGGQAGTAAGRAAGQGAAAGAMGHAGSKPQSGG